MTDWYPHGPPPEHRQLWDPERRLSSGFWSTRDSDVFWLYEGPQLIIQFHGNHWASRDLTPEERHLEPDIADRRVWSITLDSGLGAYDDPVRRRALIDEFLQWCTAREAERAAQWPTAVKLSPIAEVRFDVPFVGR